MSSPLISVIIPCYNAAPWITETLQSIDQQDVKDVEVIVVDDGSTDASQEIVRTRFPKVHSISTSRGGPSAARNAGTKIATGEFIQYLDADDCLAGGKWAAQLKALGSQNADIAYGDWQKRSESGVLWKGNGSTIIQQLRARPELDLIGNFWCPQAAYLFRRGIVEASGGWNESLRLIEDVRFLVDCALKGARFVYVPGVLAFYRVRAASIAMHGSEHFMRCCLINDLALEKELFNRGTLDREAREILTHNYYELIENSCVRFPTIFNDACAALDQLAPHFIPPQPRRAWISRCVGYRRTEWIAYVYRMCKRWMQKLTR